MNKRKKSRRNKSRSHGDQNPPDQKTPQSDVANGSDRKAAPRRQGWLLVAALILLGAAAYINITRFGEGRLPGVVPLPNDVVTTRPLTAPSSSESSTRFTRLTPVQTGIDFTHPVIPDHPMAFLYFSSMASGGTAIGDVNGDGRPDLFVASGPLQNRLFVQTEVPFQFEDKSDLAGIGGDQAWACGATMVDINADGWLDIYVANYDSPNALYINLGNGKFKDMAWEYGLNLSNACLEGAFADYDRDGFLDLYLVNYRFENPAGMPSSPPITVVNGEKMILPEFEKFYEITNDSIGYGTVGRSDGLLRNLGNGTFQDVSLEAGLHGTGHGQSATWWDFNDDGFPDLHVGNDFNDPDSLYRNNGDGTFTDVVREAVPHITWFSMGADAGDIDGDGLPDLLTSDMSSTTHFKQKTTMGSMGTNAEFLASAVPRQYMRNALLLNSGTQRFKEAAYLTNLDSTDWTWSVKLADLDCDGKLDVFFTNGSVRSFTDSDRTLTLSQRRGKTEWDLYRDTQPLREANLAFKNLGGLRFEDVSADWGLNHLGVSMSCAHGDFDGDGDLDLVVAHVDEPLTIYRNDTREHGRISVRLHGLKGNRFGVGAKISVGAEGKWQSRELQPSRGFLASNQPLAHFGLGNAEKVDIVIRWPDGGVQTHSGLAVGNAYEIKQQTNLSKFDPNSTSIRRSYQTKSGPPELAHQETDFDDYQLQPLLPHRLSRLGPAIASADFDSDGAMDFFIGGGAGQPGRIASLENGSFRLIEQPSLVADRSAEDMGALWLDADGDGDEDLFVSSGGNEFSLDAPQYQLRLYLNENGVLTRSMDRVPDIRISAGPVSAADFDRDGDVDLFIGGRQIPGKYPLPPKSYLLVNDGGVFRDATAFVFSGELKPGMVTGSLWTDVDNDDDLDLMVTTEWGAIKLYRNEENKLRDDTALAGLASYRGWWTGISSADLDNDGDLDYVATNMGLNTKYHASDEHPFRLFFGDFEGNGTSRLVEAEYENEVLFPVRGKSCSTHAIPSLGDKFKTYKAFAAATLEDIYTTECLEEAFECSANWLESVALINDGTGRFAIQTLPMEAQLSPAFGCVITHCTDDVYPDVFLAQNFFSPQPETGNMDGGLGCLLENRGGGNFEAAETKSTGIVIPEDAMAAVLAEINGDGDPDFLVATNDGPLRVIESQPSLTEFETVTVTLDVDSVSAISGARLIFRTSLSDQITEVSSGGGYLSQLPPVFFFKRPKGESATVTVRKLGGETTDHHISADKKSIHVLISRNANNDADSAP